LFRPGEPDRVLDIGAILRDGDIVQNVPLRENDTVSVQLRKAIHVTVAGAVMKPDVWLLDVGSSAVEAVAKAGGTAPGASLARAFVTRDGATIAVNLEAAIADHDPKANMELREGDTLTIPPHKAQVAVFGEVSAPGVYGVPEDHMPYLSDALAQAGGIRKSGIGSRIAVLRCEKGKTTQTLFDFHKYLKSADPAGNPPLRDGDIVVVYGNRRGDFERLVGSVLSLGLVGLLRK
jgi:protein involved in polysaccharide export with SLBB domain